MNITILGAGSWGVAIAKLLSGNQHAVTIWSIDPEEVAMLTEYCEHKTKLPGVILPGTVHFTGDIERALSEAEMVVVAVPSPFVRSTAATAAPFIKKDTIVVSVSKGIEEGTLERLSQIIAEEIPDVKIAVLSGPSHAEEVGKCIPTTVVVGSDDIKTATMVQDVFMTDFFRVYTSPDVVGIELGGALKNVIALAAGIADGMGCGDNTKAALITRGIVEITNLGTKMGGYPATFSGLSGIGDLIVTCASMHSRNRRAGILIGQGVPVDEAVKEIGMVVEGMNALPAAITLCEKFHMDMPLINAVRSVVIDHAQPSDVVKELMNRSLKTE